MQYTANDWGLAETEYDRVRRALDEDGVFVFLEDGYLGYQKLTQNSQVQQTHAQHMGLENSVKLMSCAKGRLSVLIDVEAPTTLCEG